MTFVVIFWLLRNSEIITNSIGWQKFALAIEMASFCLFLAKDIVESATFLGNVQNNIIQSYKVFETELCSALETLQED
ncbi:hypothetical protein [Polaribacter sp. Hel_I_88]|uniref:hypothetical protein n=1 Tax=Polaribacter sp. Hel_I_88 TaxID=1250006 RepID=UPI000478A239|nr:hypothetical protein [Polaribacter sp. Hel_I_88]|tara:strand:+ start:44 stop:277 length:234 start_codon:yes stop_codon:yes gene_type:complete